MSDQNEAAVTPQNYVASHIKRAVRKFLLVVIAMPAVLVAVVMALPYLLDDPTLVAGDEERQRGYLIIGASLIATYIFHLVTKSWSRVPAPTQENANGN